MRVGFLDDALSATWLKGSAAITDLAGKGVAQDVSGTLTATLAAASSPDALLIGGVPERSSWEWQTSGGTVIAEGVAPHGGTLLLIPSSAPTAATTFKVVAPAAATTIRFLAFLSRIHEARDIDGQSAFAVARIVSQLNQPGSDGIPVVKEPVAYAFTIGVQWKGHEEEPEYKFVRTLLAKLLDRRKTAAIQFANGVPDTFMVRFSSQSRRWQEVIGLGGERVLKAQFLTHPDTDKIAAAVPGPVERLRVSSGGEDFLWWTWDPPVDDGDADIIDYEAKLQKADGSGSVVTKTITAAVLVIAKFLSLEGGTDYICRVRARNTHGKGPETRARAMTSPAPVAVVPLAASILLGAITMSATVEARSILVPLSAPAITLGAPTISASIAPVAVEEVELAATVNLGAPTVACTLSIISDTVSLSAPAIALGAPTMAIYGPWAPLPPTGLSTVIADGSTTLSWTSPPTHPAVTGGSVRWRASDADAWSFPANFFTTTPNVVIPLGTSHQFQVRLRSTFDGNDYFSKWSEIHTS